MNQQLQKSFGSKERHESKRADRSNDSIDISKEEEQIKFLENMQIVKDLSQNKKGRYRILQLSNDYRTGLNGGLAYKRPNYKFKQSVKFPNNKRTPVYSTVQEEPPLSNSEEAQSMAEQQAQPIISEY